MPVLEVLPESEVNLRRELGYYRYMHEGAGARLLDCSDERRVTAEEEFYRIVRFGEPEIKDLVFNGIGRAFSADITSPNDLTIDANELEIALQIAANHDGLIHSARGFGALSGTVITGLVSSLVEISDDDLVLYQERFGEEGFVDVIADLSDTAAKDKNDPMELCIHSAEGAEKSRTNFIDHKCCEGGIGCAFATNVGELATMCADPYGSVVSNTRKVASVLDLEGYYIDEAVDGFIKASRVMPRNLGVQRGPLHHAATRQNKYIPTAIHQGRHAPNHLAKITIDGQGLRANARMTTMQRYHNTPALPYYILNKYNPIYNIDPKIAYATALLLSEATRQALSGMGDGEIGIEIIPEYVRSNLVLPIAG